MPRIYVASLSDYNDGRHHGDWVELGDGTDADDVQQAIAEILASSPMPEAEEFAIHDYEGFGALDLGEWEPIERLVFLAEMITEFGEMVVSVFVNDVLGDDTPFTEDDIRESYEGRFGSGTEFVQCLLIDGCDGYRGVTSRQLQDIADVIDWDAVASAFSDDFQYVHCGPDVLVFRRGTGG